MFDLEICIAAKDRPEARCQETSTQRERERERERQKESERDEREEKKIFFAESFCEPVLSRRAFVLLRPVVGPTTTPM